MHCREAGRMRLTEASQGLPARRRDALRAHLACCPHCAEEARMDGWIERDLAALRGEFPFELDVSARALAAIRPLGAPGAEGPSARQIGWAAATAVAAALTAASGLGSLLAGRGQALAQLIGLGRALWGTAVAIFRPLWNLTFTVLDTLASLGVMLAESSAATAFSRTAGWSVLIAWIVALSTVAWFVSRDLFRGDRPPGVKES